MFYIKTDYMYANWLLNILNSYILTYPALEPSPLFHLFTSTRTYHAYYFFLDGLKGLYEPDRQLIEPMKTYVCNLIFIIIGNNQAAYCLIRTFAVLQNTSRLSHEFYETFYIIFSTTFFNTSTQMNNRI